MMKNKRNLLQDFSMLMLDLLVFRKYLEQMFQDLKLQRRRRKRMQIWQSWLSGLYEIIDTNFICYLIDFE